MRQRRPYVVVGKGIALNYSYARYCIIVFFRRLSNGRRERWCERAHTICLNFEKYSPVKQQANFHVSLEANNCFFFLVTSSHSLNNRLYNQVNSMSVEWHFISNDRRIEANNYALHFFTFSHERPKNGKELVQTIKTQAICLTRITHLRILFYLPSLLQCVKIYSFMSSFINCSFCFSLPFHMHRFVCSPVVITFICL